MYLSESQVSEIEMEFLKEKLQELYLQAEEQEVLPEEVRNKKPSVLCVSKQRRREKGELVLARDRPGLIYKTNNVQKWIPFGRR